MWEARKIWGAIVNSSRAWGSYVKGYISAQFADQSLSDQAIFAIKQKLIYRHIAWLYALRSQLLIPTSWEHMSQDGKTGQKAASMRAYYGIGLHDDEITRTHLKMFLPEEEHDRLINYKNTCHTNHRSAVD